MSEYIAHEETQDGLTLKVIADSDACNPRKDWDQFAVMACEHGRYDLGDDNGSQTLRDAIEHSRDYRRAWDDLDTIDLIVTALPHCSDIVALPLYLYDHSGITISTGAFACPWDSGQVGFIFVTRDAILKEWGGTRLTPKLRQKAIDLMNGEVETYDDYLTGNVYGYSIEDAEGDHLDSCWGFYGDYDSDYGALSEGKAALASELADRKASDDWATKLGVETVA